MSRSRKKYSIVKQRQDRRSKRGANKKIRTYLDLENYKGYSFLKKLFNPWDICDWRWIPRNKEDKIKFSRK